MGPAPLLAAAALMLVAGCAPATDIHLVPPPHLTGATLRIVQPALTPPQDVVRLESAWAYASDGSGGSERILLAFPLPGARAGDKQFFLYLRLPGKRSAPVAIGDPLPDGSRVGGFLIQVTGKLAGKTVFMRGSVELHGVAFDGGKRRKGKLTLYCTDGSMIDGEFTAKVAPLEVRDFEDAKAADVRALAGGDNAARPAARPPGAGNRGSKP
jgi:hypothetical protein